MTTLPELLPCPFCGADARFVQSWRGGDVYSVSCDGTNECMGQNMEQDEQGGFACEGSAEHAAHKWNSRDNTITYAQLKPVLDFVADKIAIVMYDLDGNTYLRHTYDSEKIRRLADSPEILSVINAELSHGDWANRVLARNAEQKGDRYDT
jgi:hypothetical protein